MERRNGKSSIGTLKARLATLAAASTILAAVALPAAASAETAAEYVSGPRMALTFARDTARLTGAGAVVSVKCNGPRSGVCAGTLSFEIEGASHKAPFSVMGGQRRSLVVPLGDGAAESSDSGARRALATASTMQPLGAPSLTEQVLRVK
ncbi:MAG TPA: hypothetical protein VFJ57_12145 [Solirubrobacterales bacterium]|nr:hypothetical protein [Solirubrobacterales bacterium]